MSYVYIAIGSLALMVAIYAYGYNNGAEAVRVRMMKETIERAKDAKETENDIARAPDGAAAIRLYEQWGR